MATLRQSTKRTIRIGAALGQFRDTTLLTIAEIAEKTGLSVGTIHNALADSPISAGTARRIVEKLELPRTSISMTSTRRPARRRAHGVSSPPLSVTHATAGD